MNARELLEHIAARGGVATLTGEGGAAKISVAPRSLAREVLPDLQKVRPQLLELLAHGDRFADERARTPDKRAETGQNRAPNAKAGNHSPAPEKAPGSGAIRVCRVLAGFAVLLAKARAGKLPLEPLRVEMDGREAFILDDAAATVREVEATWTERARDCKATGRALNGAEEIALDAAREMLEFIEASRGPGGVWLDVEAEAERGHDLAKARAKAAQPKSRRER